MPEQNKQPKMKPLSPAQTKRLQELTRRKEAAEAAWQEFGTYLAEEHGLMGQTGWLLDSAHGAWVHVPEPPNGAGKE